MVTKSELFNLKFDMELENILNNVLEGILLREILTNKQKSIILITVFTTLEQKKLLKKQIEYALNIGLTIDEIKETIYQTTPYIGFAKVISALEEMNCLFNEKKINYNVQNSTVDSNTRFEKGLHTQQTIFGKENINKMRENAPFELKHIQDLLSAYCFGDFYTRKVFDLKTRELITFTTIISLGGCENQAKAHAKANLMVGNTKEMLIEACTLALPFIGFPRCLNAINTIE